MLNDALLIGKAKIESLSRDLKVKNGVLESALGMVLTFFHFGFFARIGSSMNINIGIVLFSLQLEKNRMEQLEKFYPNLICTQSLGHVRTLFLRS